MGRLRPLVESCSALLPALSARLIGLRSSPNLEKILFLLLVRRGDVVVDAGAHTGYYTALFSRLAGRRGSVHAFEPVPPTFASLCAHVARAGRRGNVVLNECALAAAAGEVAMLVPAGDPGQAALAPHRAGSWSGGAPVRRHACRATTLDDYVAGLALPRLDFVKCDVEGAELQVLQGAADALRRFRPLLHLEVCRDWAASFGYRPERLVEYLVPLGYTRFYLVTGELRPLGEPVQALRRLDGSANLLCAIAGRHDQRLQRLRRLTRS